MCCVKEFAGGVGRYFGSAATATGDIAIAATIAAKKLVESNVEPQTCAIEERRKESWIKKTARQPIAEDGSWHFPLWIKVPLKSLLLSISLRRYFHHRLLPEVAANRYKKSK